MGSGSRLYGFTHSNGVDISHQYDNRGRLINKQYGKKLGNLTMTLGMQGHVLSQAWQLQANDQVSTQNNVFVYDRQARLNKEKIDNLETTYVYDQAHNRLSAQVRDYSKVTDENTSVPVISTIANRYERLTNRLSRVTENRTGIDSKTIIPVLDATGNTLNDNEYEYTYSAHNRLLSVKRKSDSATTVYAYNFAGQLVRKNTATGETIYYVYGLSGELLGEYGADGQRIKEYIYLNESTYPELVAVVEANGQVVHVHTDHLLTPRLASNDSGKLVWSWLSNAFGETPANEDPDGDGVKTVINHRFPGQYYDIETNKHYNYFRDYDPKLGRYLQSDPIGLNGGINTFGYVVQNPLMYIDLFGLAKGRIIVGQEMLPATSVNGDVTTITTGREIICKCDNGTLGYYDEYETAPDYDRQEYDDYGGVPYEDANGEEHDLAEDTLIHEQKEANRKNRDHIVEAQCGK